jgi:hypothetical protein
MLCARIDATWHFYDTNGKEMFEAHTARATMPQGWVAGQVSVLQITDAALDEKLNIEPIFKRVLLDAKGNLVLEPKCKESYRIIHPVDNSGFALLANNETGESMLCNRKGEMLALPKDATNVRYKGEGMLVFVTKKDSIEGGETPQETLYDFAEKKVRLQGRWSLLGSFHQGVALVKDNENKMGMINKKGEWLIPMEYTCPIEDDWTFMEEMEHTVIILKNADDNYVLFNLEGKRITDEGYAEMPVYNYGYISVWDAERGWYIIDIDGNVMAKDVWKGNENSRGFNATGMAAITENGIYRVISHSGAELVGSQKGYKYAQYGRSTLFLSTDEITWDVYNSKGKRLNTLQAESIADFGKFRYSSFTLGDKVGIVSEEGNIIVPPAKHTFPIICDEFFESQTIEGEDIQYQYWNPSGKMVLKNPIGEMGADWIIPHNPDQRFYLLM